MRTAQPLNRHNRSSVQTNAPARWNPARPGPFDFGCGATVFRPPREMRSAPTGGQSRSKIPTKPMPRADATRTGETRYDKLITTDLDRPHGCGVIRPAIGAGGFGSA